jgi:hypothetical protein
LLSHSLLPCSVPFLSAMLTRCSLINLIEGSALL